MAGSTCNFDGVQFTGSGGNQGLWVNGGKAISHKSKWQGTTQAVLCDTSGMYQNPGGDDVLVGPFSGCGPVPTTSGNGTIALSGTGNNRIEEGMFTLTAGTTSGATPTVTITPPAAFAGPSTAGPNCTLQFLNGTVNGVAFTGTWNARVTYAITAASQTAVTFTIDNNAAALTAASTYGGQYSCGAR